MMRSAFSKVVFGCLASGTAIVLLFAGALRIRSFRPIQYEDSVPRTRLSDIVVRDGKIYLAGQYAKNRPWPEGLAGEIRNWDGNTYQITVRGMEAGENGGTTSTCLSPEGDSLMIAHSRGPVRIAASRRNIRLKLPAGGFWSLSGSAFCFRYGSPMAWSPDGKKVVGALRGIWDMNSRTEPQSTDDVVRIWSATDGRLLASAPFTIPFLTAVQFSPDGRSIAAASSEGTIKIIDATSAKRLRTIRTNQLSLGQLAWSPDGKLFAMSNYLSDGGSYLTVLDAVTGKSVFRATFPSDVKSLEFSPDGKYLALGMSDPGYRLYEVGHWSSQTQQTVPLPEREKPNGVVAKLAVGESIPTHVTWTPDSRTLVAATADRVVLQRVR